MKITFTELCSILNAAKVFDQDFTDKGSKNEVKLINEILDFITSNSCYIFEIKEGD